MAVIPDVIKLERKIGSYEKAKERQFAGAGALSANLNVMIKAARAAGIGLVRDFNELENLQVSQKSPGSFVSSADLNSESKLHLELSKARPTYGFLMEEKGEIIGEDTSHRFIIDPLDGTSNFMHAIPLFCISIALERNREIINAVVFNPITDELFIAEKGSGAFIMAARGKKRLLVSKRTKIEQALVGTSISIKTPAKEKSMDEMQKFSNASLNIRMIGSGVLSSAYVAAGKFDAFWEHRSNPWDIAAGILLVKEAGGRVIDLETNSDKDKDILNSNNILTCSDAFFSKVRKLL